MIAISWLEQFSQSGFSKALIRARSDIEPYLNTVWTVQLARGVVLSLVLFAGAPAIAGFFGSSEASAVLRVISVLLLLRGLSNPAVVHFSKDLQFGQLVKLDLSAVIVGLAAAIPLAIVYRNVWALVVSLIIGQAVKTVLTYWLHPFRPRLSVDVARARELFQFGKWIFWVNVVNAVALRMDSIIVGRLLGITILGLYEMALRLAMLPAREFTSVLSRVTYPAFVKLQGIPQLRRAYLRVLELVALFALPGAVFLMVFPHIAVRLFLGERWLEIVDVVRMLALCGALRIIGGPGGPLLQSIGRPDILGKLASFRLLLYALLVYPFTRASGMLGADEQRV